MEVSSLTGLGVAGVTRGADHQSAVGAFVTQVKENLGRYLTAEEDGRHTNASPLHSQIEWEEESRWMHAHLENPRAPRVRQQRLESCPTLRSTSANDFCSYRREHGSCASSTTSARARPYAESTPLYLQRRHRDHAGVYSRSGGGRRASLLLVDEDGLHAEGSGYSAGVLATCAAKTGEHVLRGVVTLSLKGCREVAGWVRIQF